jgi:hypothetical protein
MHKVIAYATCFGMVLAFGIVAAETRAYAHRDPMMIAIPVVDVAPAPVVTCRTVADANDANGLRAVVDDWLRYISQPLDAEAYLVAVGKQGGIVMSTKGGQVCKGMHGVGGTDAVMATLMQRMFGEDHTI